MSKESDEDFWLTDYDRQLQAEYTIATETLQAVIVDIVTTLHEAEEGMNLSDLFSLLGEKNGVTWMQFHEIGYSLRSLGITDKGNFTEG